MRRPIKYQILKQKITAAGDYAIKAECDKSYRKVTGIQFTTTDTNSLKDAVLNKFELDANELFAEGFEVKLIRTSESVKPDDRFHALDERGEGSTINAVYHDAGQAISYPYTARFYLRLENPID